MTRVRELADLSPLEREVAQEFALRVRASLGDRVRDMRVFGSRARQEAREDSDLDVLVRLEEAHEHERVWITDLSTDLWMQRELPFVISPRVVSEAQWRELVEGERLLPSELERDGIPL